MPENIELMQDRFDGHVVQRRYDGRRVPLMVAGICCAMLAVICMSGFTYVLFLQPTHANTVYAAQDEMGDVSDHRADVSLPIYLPDLDTRSSRIPVKITGTLADGTAFDKDTYVSKDGKGLRLEPGTYELHVSGSPISSSGVMYSAPDVGVTIVIGDDLVVSLDPPDFISFGVIGAMDVTEEQIAAACEFIKNDPERTQYADTLAEQVRDRKREAVRAAEAASAARVETARVVAEQGYKVPEVQQIVNPVQSDSVDYSTNSNAGSNANSSTSSNASSNTSSNTNSSANSNQSSGSGSGSSSGSGSGSSSNSYGSGSGSSSSNYGNQTDVDDGSDYPGSSDTSGDYSGNSGNSGNSGGNSSSYVEPDITPVDTGDSGYTPTSPSDSGYSGESSYGSDDATSAGGSESIVDTGDIVDADGVSAEAAVSAESSSPGSSTTGAE